MANVNQRQKGFSKEQSKIRVLAIAMMLKNGQTISTSQILRKLELQYGMTPRMAKCRLPVLSLAVILIRLPGIGLIG